MMLVQKKPGKLILLESAIEIVVAATFYIIMTKLFFKHAGPLTIAVITFFTFLLAGVVGIRLAPKLYNYLGGSNKKLF